MLIPVWGRLAGRGGVEILYLEGGAGWDDHPSVHMGLAGLPAGVEILYLEGEGDQEWTIIPVYILG